MVDDWFANKEPRFFQERDSFMQILYTIQIKRSGRFSGPAISPLPVCG